MNPKLLRNLAVYGVSLPTFIAPPALAKDTVYMPSQVAAKMLGGRASRPGAEQQGSGQADAPESNAA